MNDYKSEEELDVKAKKRVLFVNPKATGAEQDYEVFPSGAFLLMGTMLLDAGYKVRLVHMTADRVDNLQDIIADFQPDIVGVTMSTFQTVSAKKICKEVKEIDSNILVVLGGPHPSALRCKIFDAIPDADISVLGEGEHTFMEIVEGKDFSDIKGICLKGVENPPRDMVENLDDIPLTRLDLIDIKSFAGADPARAFPNMFVMASRGCPFGCTFCNKSIWGTNLRLRKPELVVREVEWLHTEYGIREIFFLDDTFNVNRAWAEEVFGLIIEKGLNKRITFKVSFRANKNLVDEELLRLAKKAGVWVIFYGVESGSQMMLDSMKKGLTLDEIRRAFAMTHKVGIKTIGSFMIGLPGETEETAMQTKAFMKELHPLFTGFGPAVPLPNTELDRIVTEKGHKLINDYDEYSPWNIVIRTDALDETEIKDIAQRIRRYVHRQFFIDLFMLRYRRVVMLKSWRIAFGIFKKIVLACSKGLRG